MNIWLHLRSVPNSYGKLRAKSSAQYLHAVLLVLLLLVFQAVPSLAQVSSYHQYIEKYSAAAVEQMQLYGIPASITLAQGLLESGAGRSKLATKGNNHFGIKVSGNWTGPYMLVDDDRPDEKFRVYKSADESFQDHSVFLRTGRRYAGLFNLDRTDYKGWARGLKAAGYATNPRYAEMLIDLIERFNLHQYDRGGLSVKQLHRLKEVDCLNATRISLLSSDGLGDVRECNGAIYVRAMGGETYKSIGKKWKISQRKLRKYNETDKRHVLKQGEIVYLEKKRSKADKKHPTRYHILQAGESLHDVAQCYGIRLKSLCRKNKEVLERGVKVGDIVRIK